MPPSPVFLVAATVLLTVISLWGVSIALVFLLTRFVIERKKVDFMSLKVIAQVRKEKAK